MKKLLLNATIVFIAILALSCDDNCCTSEENNRKAELLGQWLVVEEGGSPGSGYYINEVSPVPPQILNFKGNWEFSSTAKGLTHFKYYAVKGDIVGLFVRDPGPNPDSSAFTHSYHARFEDGLLKLGYRYCFEGCHIGLKKIE